MPQFFQNDDQEPARGSQPKPERKPHLPLITPKAVQLALVAGARTPLAIAQTFGISMFDKEGVRELADATAVLIKRQVCRPAADGTTNILLAGESREPGDNGGIDSAFFCGY